MVLYRKYRPQTFAELIGQEHIATSFSRAISNNAVAHAYLFCGPRGLGKTSTARIVAKAINCEAGGAQQIARSKKPQTTSHELQAPIAEPCNQCYSCNAITNGTHLDVIEIDAASNRGIDDIRELKERIKLSPATATKKIYIIDEVHMLTTEAFNALLKTLEEPPEHAVLILATTEAHKVPQTIVSRCERFDFPKASSQSLATVLTHVCEAEHLTIDENAKITLAELADGSFRDAIKLLDQIATLRQPITDDLVSQYFKVPQHTQVASLFQAITSGNTHEALAMVAGLRDAGFAMTPIIVALLQHCRMLVMPGATSSVPPRDLMTLLKLMSVAERETRTSPIPELPLELAIVEWIAATKPELVTPLTQPKPAAVVVPQPKQPASEPEPVPVVVEAPTDQAIAPEELGAMLGESSDSIVMADEPVPIEAIADMVTIAPAPTASPEQKITITKLSETWPSFVTDLLVKNHSAGLLLKNATLDDFDGEIVTVAVSYKFHKERIEQEKMRATLEAELGKRFGKPVIIACVLKEKKKVKADAEELADAAQQIFGAELL